MLSLKHPGLLGFSQLQDKPAGDAAILVARVSACNSVHACGYFIQSVMWLLDKKMSMTEL